MPSTTVVADSTVGNACRRRRRSCPPPPSPAMPSSPSKLNLYALPPKQQVASTKTLDGSWLVGVPSAPPCLCLHLYFPNYQNTIKHRLGSWLVGVLSAPHMLNLHLHFSLVAKLPLTIAGFLTSGFTFCTPTN